VIEACGHRLLLSDGETLDLVKGERMKIVDIIPSFLSSPELKVNFKGFVGNRKNNTGEDRGYTINTATDLMTRYSLNRKGNMYKIIASLEEKILGRFFIRLRPPELDYVILKVNGDCHRVLRAGEMLSLSSRDEIRLEEIQTNIHGKSGFHLSINGHILKPGETRGVDLLFRGALGSREHEVLVKKDGMILGRIRLALE